MADYNKLYCYATGKTKEAILFKSIAKPMSLEIASAKSLTVAITPDTVNQLFELTQFDTVDNFLTNATFKNSLVNDYLRVYNEFAIEVHTGDLDLDEINDAIIEIETKITETTASNKNTTGYSLFISKIANILGFKGLNSPSNSVTITDNLTTKTLDLEVDSANINHQDLLGSGSNTHTQIDSHIADVTKHRQINDSGTTTTDLLSASKIYSELETFALGFSGKADVRVVTEGLGDVVLAGEQTIHGFLTNSSRVGVTDQTLPAQNGIYTTGAGAWTRTADFDGSPSNEVRSGSFFFVSEDDNTYAGARFFVLGNSTSINVGVDNIDFEFRSSFGFGDGAGQAIEGTNPRVPSQDENDALLGTNGAPNLTNRYITDSDPRIPTPDENDALQGTNGSPSNSNRYVTDSDPRLTGGGGGGNTTASNENTAGIGVFIQKTVDNLEFKGVASTTNRIGIVNNPTNKTIDVTLNENNISHDNLAGIGANTHTDIDMHIADVTKHRQINDSGTSTTDLLSASKVLSLINGIESGRVTKAPVHVVTKGLGNQTRFALYTIHGYTLQHNDRVGLVEQLDPIDNGIWIAKMAAAWVRATDFDGNPTGEVTGGTQFFVSEDDNTYAGSRFFVLGAADNIINVGTDPITFDSIAGVEFGDGAGQAIEGNNPRVPLQDENDALLGTAGTPSSTNKYVTNDDTRNTNSRTPTAHATTHKHGGSDEIAVVSPVANGIPKADGTGKLDSGWIPASAGSSFPTFNINAEDFNNTDTANWAVNSSAVAQADPTNSALIIRSFSATVVNGVGIMFRIPTGVTNIIFDTISRSSTSPGAPVGVVQKLYRRTIPDNGSISSWSSALGMTAITMPSGNTNFQYDTQTISLVTLGLTAGNLVQIQMVRDGADAGDTLSVAWYLLQLRITFS